MGPSILSLTLTALALTGTTTAVKWRIQKTYDASNFFSEFVFNTDPDPNGSSVSYLSQSDAVALGIASCAGGEVRLGVDSKTDLTGMESSRRSSVRLESRARFNKVLVVARFNHLPESICGSWPAFWTFGNTWPTDGEIDIIEAWNLAKNNKPVFHVGSTDTQGQCALDGANQTAAVASPNCDNAFQDPPRQYRNQGCVSDDDDDRDGPFASPEGGVYAMEWTSDAIRIYSWRHAAAPRDIASDYPDTTGWGTPVVNLKSSACNVDGIFRNQRLVIDLALCGNPVEKPGIWDECRAVTGKTCAEYVREHPAAFKNVYFAIRDIRVFGQDGYAT